MSESISWFAVAVRLFLFGIFTSFGYLLYGVFLTDVGPLVLTLNTFVWLFILQCIRFEGRTIRLRSPLRAIQFVVSTHSLGFALCQFAYWILFWFAASTLKDSSSVNFAPLALALLSLNTLATPLAMHFAKRDQENGHSIAPFVALALPLALSIVLIELDMTWRDFSPKLNFLDGIDWSFVSIEISSPAFLMAVCLMAAVFAEATGDFLLTRLEILKSLGKKKFAHRLELAAFVGDEADKFGAQTPVQELLMIIEAVCHDNLADASIEHDSTRATLREIETADFDARQRKETEQRLRAIAADSAEVVEGAERRLHRVLSYSIEASTGDTKRLREIRRRVVSDYWDEICSHVEANLDDDARKRMQEDARERPVDLMAIIGLAISSLLGVIELTRTGSLPSVPSLWLIAILCLLGLTGSSARPLLLLPLLRHQAEALIPPIYAVRPVLYLALGWLLLTGLHLRSWIQTNVPLGTKLDVLPNGNATYQIGVLLAVASAAAAWGVAYRRSRQERGPSR